MPTECRQPTRHLARQRKRETRSLVPIGRSKLSLLPKRPVDLSLRPNMLHAARSPLAPTKKRRKSASWCLKLGRRVERDKTRRFALERRKKTSWLAHNPAWRERPTDRSVMATRLAQRGSERGTKRAVVSIRSTIRLYSRIDLCRAQYATKAREVCLVVCGARRLPPGRIELPTFRLLSGCSTTEL